MMLDELEEVKFWEGKRHFYEGKTNSTKIMRDLSISKAFGAGNRQKEIGNACGLSESTIKHIIANRKIK